MPVRKLPEFNPGVRAFYRIIGQLQSFDNTPSKYVTEWCKSHQKKALVNGKQIQEWDKGDYEANLEIETYVAWLLAQHPKTDESTPGLVNVNNLRVGEVSRHFESGISGDISGWMQHHLVAGFWAYSQDLNILDNGGIFSFGRTNIGGTSSVNLNLTARSSEDLLSDSFLVVFDRVLPDGDIDTVRLIIPSDRVCRKAVSELLTDMGSEIAPESWRDQALCGLAPAVVTSVDTAGSYAGDKLSAYVRNTASSPETIRPSISFLGTELRHSVYFGSAIRFGESEWHELFPTALIVTLTDAIASISAKHGVPVGLRL